MGTLRINWDLCDCKDKCDWWCHVWLYRLLFAFDENGCLELPDTLTGLERHYVLGAIGSCPYKALTLENQDGHTIKTK